MSGIVDLDFYPIKDEGDESLRVIGENNSLYGVSAISPGAGQVNERQKRCFALITFPRLLFKTSSYIITQDQMYK